MVVGLYSFFTGVLHHFLHVVEFGTVDSHVEVTGDNHRKAIRIDAVNPVNDELHSILAGFPSYVVEVGVDIVVFLAAGLVLEQCPCGCAEAGGIPSH